MSESSWRFKSSHPHGLAAGSSATAKQSLVASTSFQAVSAQAAGLAPNTAYHFRLAATNSLVLVPVSNASEVGLRRPITSGECETLFKVLATDFATPAHDWKDRFKDFSERMRSGNIFEVAEVLKHLNYLSQIKPLSFREQRMFERSRYLVISELAIVCRQPECNIEPRVDQALTQACARHARRSVAKARAVGAGAH